MSVWQERVTAIMNILTLNKIAVCGTERFDKNR